MFLAERDLVAERRELLATLDQLDRDHLESGPTLCAGWAPRDVLAHLVAIDEAVHNYLTAGLRIHAVNKRQVERWRERDLDELLDRVRSWAAEPSITSRMAAYGLLGDLSVHHQDIARAAGVQRQIPDASRRAILREGCILGGKKLLSHRVIPTDTGRAIGRGTPVRGTAEQLGMWLCGRDVVTPELSFGAG